MTIESLGNVGEALSRAPFDLGDVFDTAGVDSGDGVGIYIADS